MHNFSAAYTYTTTTTTSGTGHVSAGLLLGVYLAFFLLLIPLIIIPLWKIFKKAGKPGWAAIIPVYSTWVLFEIVGYPGWWAILSLVPIVSIFPAIMALVAYFKLAKGFGKTDLFAVMTVLFPWVCLPILGYGKATFGGNDASGVNGAGDPPYPNVIPNVQAPSVTDQAPITVQPQAPSAPQSAEATPAPVTPTSFQAPAQKVVPTPPAEVTPSSEAAVTPETTPPSDPTTPAGPTTPPVTQG